MKYNPASSSLKALFHMWRWILRHAFLEPARKTLGNHPKPKGRYPEDVYWRAVLWNTVFWVIIPLILLFVNEVTYDWRWFTAVIGFLLAASTLWVAYVATPLGVAIDELTAVEGGLGSRYVRFVRGVLFGELALAMFLWILPWSNGKSIILPFVVAALTAFLGFKILGKRGNGFVKLATSLAVIMLVVFPTLLFLPSLETGFTKSVSEADLMIAKMVGDPKADRFHRYTGDSQHKIFRDPVTERVREVRADWKFDPGTGEKLRPITPEAAVEIDTLQCPGFTRTIGKKWEDVTPPREMPRVDPVRGKVEMRAWRLGDNEPAISKVILTPTKQASLPPRLKNITKVEMRAVKGQAVICIRTP